MSLLYRKRLLFANGVSGHTKIANVKFIPLVQGPTGESPRSALGFVLNATLFLGEGRACVALG